MRGFWSASLLHLLRPFYSLSWPETMKILSFTVLWKEMVEEDLNWNWTQAFTVAGTPGANTEPLKSSRCGLLSLQTQSLFVWGMIWKSTADCWVQLVHGCPRWIMAFLMPPEKAKHRDWGFCFFFPITQGGECETVEDRDCHTMACIPQTLEWFCRWLWHYWRYGPYDLWEQKEIYLSPTSTKSAW